MEMIPDETAHFWRAFEISIGGFVSEPIGNSFGAVLPRAVINCHDRTAVIDWKDMVEHAFPESSLYSPVSYLPQSVGILLARCFTGRVCILYYAGRLFNFITAFILSLLALKKIPFGRKILFVILCMPMTLQEMISLAPDAFVNSMSFAVIAFVLHCAYECDSISWKSIVLL